MRYDFEFSWDSTYGYAARLVGAHSTPGLVVDLGSGLGTFSLPLTELGYTYLGFEYDDESVRESRRRGVDCEQIDLRDLDGLNDRVLAAVGGREVSAVSLLDVVEHLPEPSAVLDAVVALLDALTVDGRAPLLVLSIPNVSHVDLAAKLAFGRWDVTEVGLLDSTHITLFDHERLASVTRAAGLVEVGSNDVVFAETEQRFPSDHPSVADTPVRRYLESLRRQADPFGLTYQFVRCYRHGLTSVGTTAPAEAAAPRWSVIAPSTGGAALVETLATAIAQPSLDIEVCIVAPTRCAGQVIEYVHHAAPPQPERIRMDVVETENRVDMLNAGLAMATGELVVFVPEGDVLDADVLARFADAAERHPGRMIRASLDTPAETAEHSNDFDLLRHLTRDETPLSSIAIPRRAIEALGLRFVDVGNGLEVWDLVLRAAAAIGVVDVGRPVGDGRVAVGAPASTAGAAVPTDARSSADGESLLLPPGSLPVVRLALAALAAQPELQSQNEIARQRIDALERSRYWRITAPVRRLTSKRPSLRPWRSTSDPST